MRTRGIKYFKVEIGLCALTPLRDGGENREETTAKKRCVCLYIIVLL